VRSDRLIVTEKAAAYLRSDFLDSIWEPLLRLQFSTTDHDKAVVAPFEVYKFAKRVGPSRQRRRELLRAEASSSPNMHGVIVVVTLARGHPSLMEVLTAQHGGLADGVEM